MTRFFVLLSALAPSALLAAEAKVIVPDVRVQAVCATPTGKVFVATSDGVHELDTGKLKPFAQLAKVTALAPFQQMLFAINPEGVHRISLATGKVEIWESIKNLPGAPVTIAGLATDERGNVYTAEAHNPKSNSLLQIGVKFTRPGQPVTRGTIKKVADLPGGADVAYSLASDGLNHVLALGTSTGLARVNISTGKSEPVLEKLPTAQDLQMDQHGRLFFRSEGAVWGIPRPSEKPVKMLSGLAAGQGLAIHPQTREVLIPTTSGLQALPAQIPGWEVNEQPLPVQTELAFADITWTGWDSGEETGRINPLRPIVLTHAGDGSGRTFVATQQGVIHIIEKNAKATKVFLDLQNKVLYKDNENEQGLLGLAFSPQFHTQGEFYLFYTDKSKVRENVLSRFRVRKDNPNQADPTSEEELLRISHKYWNHDGGTVAFGPDGYLYLVLGDGGSGNDPDDNGQNPNTLLGKILRLDVSKKGPSTPYAIPADNPFVGKPNHRPEIFALGVRNPWRMSFDRKTGQGWFGEVGQNLWEEINLLEKGANYGWRRRESQHPFGVDGVGSASQFTEPVWEYNHDVGKSITGGHVYRGKAVPALEGHYLYADYVSGKIWGLQYDEQLKRVRANRPIASRNLPILSFGEDEAGEVYLMTYSSSGKGIYRFVPAGK